MTQILDAQDGDDYEELEAEVNRTLFLRSLPDKTTEDELYELFLQAGPLEKVAIPQGKNMAFITFKHSVSAPYAKELFSDTKLHGRMLNIVFRTGSRFAEDQRQPNRGSYHQGNRHPRENGNSGHGNRNRSYQSQRSADSYNSPGQQNGILPYPPANLISMGYVASTGQVQNPFAASPLSMPQRGIQGYRSSAGNREYVPQYVSFDNPPEQFRGAVPVNHPDHDVSLDERRNRLLHQQHYVTQADAHRQMRRDYRR